MRDFEEPKHLYLEYGLYSIPGQITQPALQWTYSSSGYVRWSRQAAFALYECCPNSMVSFLDVSDKMLEIAPKRADKENITNIIPIQADAFSFLEQEGEYDLIIFSSAIHHFKDPG